ncbi:AraC family transcriptional regulator [Nocardioides sp. cx-169]|uniref:helix-turn-helix domain-containing protein n=1 Tax=Nocardioides sp. cx-169 TaxID=2899080 RepID=UPI001E2E05CD|nr:AraC family transcriptional regulator [Nocardioides sp. cx-169]MCD4535804.1 AraC family transcriptional regulator [Nocardioides sp. cx-169]
MSESRESTNRRLLRARDLMDRTYAEPLDVGRLAAAALMSPAHFAREFKRVFGEPPHRYLLRRRIERAMFLLRTRDRPVGEICHRVGFTSIGTFGRVFRRLVGCSPSAFRERSQDRAQRAPTSFAMRWQRPGGSSSFGEALTRRGS